LNSITTPKKTNTEIDRVVKWIHKNDIEVLNIAGNVDTIKTGTAIFDQVEAFLINMFTNL